MPDPQISLTDILSASQRAALTANELVYEMRQIHDYLSTVKPKPARKLRAVEVVIAHLLAEVAAYNAIGAGAG